MRLTNPNRKQQAGINSNAQLIIDTPNIPDGFELVGIDLVETITPTGSAGTGTSSSSAVIKSVQIFNERGDMVLNAQTGLALALAAAASALKYQDSTAIPPTGPGVFDQDGVLAGNTAVNSLYRIIANLRGRAYRIVVNYFLPTLTGYTTQPTSYTASVNAVLLCVPIALAIEPECAVACIEIDANTRFDASDQSIGAEYHEAVILSTSQLDTNLTGLSHGDMSYNPEQIANLERSTTNNAGLAGVTASGLTVFAIEITNDTSENIVAASSAAITLFIIARNYDTELEEPVGV
jgi:hypothetical protein